MGRIPTELQKRFLSADKELENTISQSTEKLRHDICTVLDFVTTMHHKSRLRARWQRQMQIYKRRLDRRHRHVVSATAIPVPSMMPLFVPSIDDQESKVEAEDTGFDSDNDYPRPQDDPDHAPINLLEPESFLYSSYSVQNEETPEASVSMGYDAVVEQPLLLELEDCNKFAGEEIDTEYILMQGLCLLRAMSSRDFASYNLWVDEGDDHLEDDLEQIDNEDGTLIDYDMRSTTTPEPDELKQETFIPASTEKHGAVACRTASMISQINGDCVDVAESLSPLLLGQEEMDVSHTNSDFAQEFATLISDPDFDVLALNVLLLRIALSIDLTSDEGLETLMTTLTKVYQLVDLGAAKMQPDDVTHEIILHALRKRLHATTTGVDHVWVMLERKAPWNSFSLLAAIGLCDTANNLDLAIQLVTLGLVERGPHLQRIPARAFRAVINMAKRLDRVDDAATVLRHCLEDYGRDRRTSQLITDEILTDAIRWPDRNRSGQRLDNTDAIQKLFSVLDLFPFYHPGYHFWKEAIFVCAKGADNNQQRWHLVIDAFQRLSSDAQDYWPENKLLRIGLSASEAMRKPALAADLTRRLVVNSPQTRQAALMADNNKLSSPLFSALDLERAVVACLADPEALRSALESIFDLGDQLPVTFQKHLFELGVKGYAAKHDPETAEALLQALIDRGFELSEDTYGAVIHAFAASRQLDQAILIFQDMESGDLPCRPGSSSYNGLLVGYVLARNWSDAIAVFDNMRRDGVSPLPSSVHAVLLATYRHAGKDKALDFLKVLVETESTLTVSVCKLAAKIVLDLSGTADLLTSDSLREHIRGAKDEEILDSLRTIMASWRSAERKEESIPSGSMSSRELDSRRQRAWTDFLITLLRHAELPISLL